MTSEQSKTIYLKDYRPTPYLIKHVHLNIILHEDKTEVYSDLQIEKNPGQEQAPLELHGSELELEDIKLDQKILKPGDYELTETSLLINRVPDKCVLSTKVIIRPHENLALEGLYKSKGTYCTQCEAEGFRRITYYYDRPDILATFTVRLEANQDSYPVLLSNGNCIDKGPLVGGRHFTVWEDPFPKPSYLFAVVAGDLAEIHEDFTTQSKKNVKLSIFAKHEDISKCEYALESLAKALKWDEDTFGLECDLNEYKVVAIGDFNLGAMENKGLNIFNTALVLANPDIARDANYQSILAVIGHEYFHNWTGNRVTCRDWFQLCLKEGLTVYRDQEFSRSFFSPAVVRIEDVKLLKQFQWPEDDSPIAHPPRPDRYIEINNFYTSTVYNKGAEVVRMLCTIIGKDHFRKGMDLYFEKFDGMAVCQEEFIEAMSQASGQDLNQFMNWYTQAGTPSIEVNDSYDPSKKTYTLTFKQSCQSNGVQKQTSAKHIPLKMGLLAENGKEIPLQLNDETSPGACERVFSLTKDEESLTFTNIDAKPIPSLFRDFSAPVKVKSFLSHSELQFLMSHDTDHFNVWESGQTLYTHMILDVMSQKHDPLRVDQKLLDSVGSILSNDHFDHAFKAHALTLPSEQLIAQQFDIIDPDAIHTSREHVISQIALAHQKSFKQTYLSLLTKEDYSPTKDQIGARSLKNVCLRYLHTLKTPESKQMVLDQYHNARNMTDRDAALALIIESDFAERDDIVHSFYKQWQKEDNAIDRWFSLQASQASDRPKELIDSLVGHEAFKLENPNRMRSVLVSFFRNNPVSFHHKSGYGYKLCSEYVLKLDHMNRHMASLLAKSLTNWRKYDEHRQKLILNELEFISKQNLSPDVYEIVTRSLPN